MEEVTSAGTLEEKSIKELTEIYNSKCDAADRITKFRDKETAVRRVLEVLSGKQEGEKPKLRAKRGEGKRTKAKKEKAEKAEGDNRRKLFNLKPASKLKSIRPGTKRAKIVELLTEGATFEEVQKATGWDNRTAREGIILLNKHVGYGIKEDSSTRVITLVTP
jgi:hypothetical protein